MRRIAVSFTALTAILAVAACSEQAQQTGGATGSGSNMGSTASRPTGGGVMSEAERLAQMQRELQASVGDRVFFGTDSYALSSDAKATLSRQVAFLNRYPSVMVRVEGHTDERGTREYNLALGDRRAQAAKEYLLAQGISSARIATSTFGKERPEAIGSNEQAWAQNRRAVTVIVQ